MGGWGGEWGEGNSEKVEKKKERDEGNSLILTCFGMKGGKGDGGVWEKVASQAS